jgi:inorganic pyrophosphatase/exopolyphosphatase
MSVYVVGHSSPDTDSVAAAIAFANYLKATGTDAVPVVQATELNPESKLVLDRFGLAQPEALTDAAGKEMALVDFSDIAQAPANIGDAEVVAIVDHHKIGDITTGSPILFYAKPVGCTCTVLHEMYKNNNVDLPKNIAGAMLSAILSDTVNFKSPTCTLDQVAGIRSDLVKGLQEVKGEGRHTVIMMLTDVVKEGSELLVFSDEPAVVEQAFNGKLSDNTMYVDGMMSRKKQTVPPLQKAFGA